MHGLSPYPSVLINYLIGDVVVRNHTLHTCSPVLCLFRGISVGVIQGQVLRAGRNGGRAAANTVAFNSASDEVDTFILKVKIASPL